MTEQTEAAAPTDVLSTIEPIAAREAVESLTGFDEIAIAQVYGKEFSELGRTMTVRALLFVALRRKGAKDSEAYRTSMTLPLKQLDSYFVNDEEEGQSSNGDVDAFLEGRSPEA